MGEVPMLHLPSWSRVEAVECPACKALLPASVHQAIWIEVPLGEGWVACYRLVPSGDRPVVAEARVLSAAEDPSRERHRSGRSLRPEALPPGGLPGRVLSRLRLTDPLEVLPAAIGNWERRAGRRLADRDLARHGLSTRSMLWRAPRGPAGRDDGFYAVWAQAYVAACAAGSRHPIKDLAADPPSPIEGYVSTPEAVSRRTVTEIVRNARRRGLLSAPRHAGKAGGRLTPKARRLLAAGDG